MYCRIWEWEVLVIIVVAVVGSSTRCNAGFAPQDTQ